MCRILNAVWKNEKNSLIFMVSQWRNDLCQKKKEKKHAFRSVVLYKNLICIYLCFMITSFWSTFVQWNAGRNFVTFLTKYKTYLFYIIILWFFTIILSFKKETFSLMIIFSFNENKTFDFILILSFKEIRLSV